MAPNKDNLTPPFNCQLRKAHLLKAFKSREKPENSPPSTPKHCCSFSSLLWAFSTPTGPNLDPLKTNCLASTEPTKPWMNLPTPLLCHTNLNLLLICLTHKSFFLQTTKLCTFQQTHQTQITKPDPTGKTSASLQYFPSKWSLTSSMEI